MAENYTPYQKNSRLKHLEQMEGWRNKAYTLNDNSGVTIGFGIDFSQPPYNTLKGLTENGFTQSQAEAIMQTGVLGKTVKELKKEKFDFNKIKEINIPDTEEQKMAIAKPIFNKTDEILAKYKDNVTPEVYNALTTLVHFGGGKGKDGTIDSKDPFERKNAAIYNVFKNLDKAIEENPNTVLQNRIVLDSMQESMEALSIDSPMNSTTLLREMEYIDPNVVKDRDLDIYKKKKDESYSELSRRARLRKKEAVKDSGITTEKDKKEELKQDKESIDKGVIGMGDVQLSPDFIRGVQDGSIPIYDEDAKNAIMVLDADDPGSTLSAKEYSSIKDNLPEGSFLPPGMDKGLIQPVEETATVQVGPDAPIEEGVVVEEDDDPIIFTDEDELDIEAAPEEEEEIEIYQPEEKKGEKDAVEEVKKEDSWFKKNSGDLARGALGLLSAAIGAKHMSKAMEDIPIKEGHQLDGAWKAYMAQMREMASSGLSAEERASAKQDLSTAYNLGVKNVMRAAGGSRAAFLANAGVLNANRVKGLLKLHATDAALQRENLQNYGKALTFQQQHGQRKGEIDQKMAYNEAKRKSDIHGTIGATLIGEALKTVSYGLEKRNNKKYMEAWQDSLESKQNVLDLKEELGETKGQYENLMKNYEKESDLKQETNVN